MWSVAKWPHHSMTPKPASAAEQAVPVSTRRWPVQWALYARRRRRGRPPPPPWPLSWRLPPPGRRAATRRPGVPWARPRLRPQHRCPVFPRLPGPPPAFEPPRGERGPRRCCRRVLLAHTAQPAHSAQWDHPTCGPAPMLTKPTKPHPQHCGHPGRRAAAADSCIWPGLLGQRWRHRLLRFCNEPGGSGRQRPSRRRRPPSALCRKRGCHRRPQHASAPAAAAEESALQRCCLAVAQPEPARAARPPLPLLPPRGPPPA
mmetsp:Transcript_57132/g.125486  ORF Transcript_57132/g.125486 Transcript_57132/m.125486 type:complete len:259 (-) Transcript_57132:1777-2553(-)